MARDHGTRACYVWGPAPGPGKGCRCIPCTRASTDAAAYARRMMAYGRWEPYVDAEPARAHVLTLTEYGLGWKRVCALSGVPTGVMSKLLYGTPGGRPPSKRVRLKTSEAIFRVEPDPALLAGGHCTDPTGTHRRLQALVALGWSQNKLAERLHLGRGNFGKMMEAPQVRMSTERMVRALYGELWETPPPNVGHRDKISVSRSLRYASEHGWVPPLAWDDDEIDDPAAVPADGWRRKRRRPPRELAAEGRELLRFGYDRNQAAERIDVSRSYLDTVLARFPDEEEIITGQAS